MGPVPESDAPNAQPERDAGMAADEERLVDSSVQEAVGVTTGRLEALFLLESVRGFGPQKFRELRDAGVAPEDVVAAPSKLPTGGKRGDTFRAAIGELGENERALARRRAVRQILRAHENSASVLTYDHEAYPRSVLDSNNPVPVLYVRGSLGVVAEGRGVACVGSRAARPPYAELHRAFAAAAARVGFCVVSGFALGADTAGHVGALEAGGQTLAVMPSGLDRPFPPENKPLWEQLLTYPGAAFVSEFPFGTGASSLSLRKRNKLIVAFARGVLLSQTSQKGGAMNAYRFALEQKKPVATFAADATPDTSGNQLIASETPSGGSLLSDRTSTVFPLEGRPDLWESWLRRL